MSTPKTPNINLNLPVPGPTGTPDPAWAEQLNENFEIIDEAINALGTSTSRASTFDVDADINMDGRKLTALMGMVLQSLTSALANPASIYVKNGELYYKDASNNEIRMTNAGQLDAKGIFGQYQSSDAYANYVAADGTYEFWDNALKTSASSIRAGDIILAKKGSNGAVAVRLRMNGGTAVGFTLTLPAALPGVNSVVSVDNNGNMTFSNSLSGLTISGSEFISGVIRGNTTIGANAGDTITIGSLLGVVNMVNATIQDSFLGQSDIHEAEISNSKLKGTSTVGVNTGDNITIGRTDGGSTVLLRKVLISGPSISGGFSFQLNIDESVITKADISNSDISDSEIDDVEITNSLIQSTEMNNSTIEGVPTADIAALVVGGDSTPNIQDNKSFSFDEMDRLSPTQSTDSSGNIQRTFWNGLSYQLTNTALNNYPGRFSSSLGGGGYGKAGLYSNAPLQWADKGLNISQTFEINMSAILIGANYSILNIGFFDGQALAGQAIPSGTKIPLVRIRGSSVPGYNGYIQVWNPSTSAWTTTSIADNIAFNKNLIIKIETKTDNTIKYTFIYDGITTTYGAWAFDGSSGKQYAGSGYMEIDAHPGKSVGACDVILSYMYQRITNLVNGR